MIDASIGVAFVDKTPEAKRNLIANMVANSQQFGTRLDPPSKHVKEVNISSLEQQIASLTSLVRQMAVGNMQTAKACGICSVVGLLELCGLKNNTMHFYLIIKFYFHIHKFYRYISLFKCGI